MPCAKGGLGRLELDQELQIGQCSRILNTALSETMVVCRNLNDSKVEHTCSKCFAVQEA
jgi:hypothetical protein